MSMARPGRTSWTTPRTSTRIPWTTFAIWARLHSCAPAKRVQGCTSAGTRVRQCAPKCCGSRLRWVGSSFHVQHCRSTASGRQRSPLILGRFIIAQCKHFNGKGFTFFKSLCRKTSRPRIGCPFSGTNLQGYGRVHSHRCPTGL